MVPPYQWTMVLTWNRLLQKPLAIPLAIPLQETGRPEELPGEGGDRAPRLCQTMPRVRGLADAEAATK